MSQDNQKRNQQNQGEGWRDSHDPDREARKVGGRTPSDQEQVISPDKTRDLDEVDEMDEDREDDDRDDSGPNRRRNIG